MVGWSTYTTPEQAYVRTKLYNTHGRGRRPVPSQRMSAAFPAFGNTQKNQIWLCATHGSSTGATVITTSGVRHSTAMPTERIGRTDHPSLQVGGAVTPHHVLFELALPLFSLHNPLQLFSCVEHINQLRH